MSDTHDALAEIERRWATYHDRGAHDYTDAGCRVLAEHAFRDIPVLLAALRAGSGDSEPTFPDEDFFGPPDPVPAAAPHDETLREARELAVAVADKDALYAALAEVHEFQCGCDQPGSAATCVAKPEGTFAVLAAVRPDTTKVWGPERMRHDPEPKR